MADRRSFRVALETPEGFRFFYCGEDEHIWDVAAANEIALPAICQQGRCLTCAGRLLEGTLEHDHADSYFAEDQAEGFVLLYRTMPRSGERIRTHQACEMRNHRIA